MGSGNLVSDQKFCMEAIKVHQETFGDVPKIYGFDRGGYSAANIKKAKKMKIKHIGIAPTGKAQWSVSKTMEKHIKNQRAQVEGCIGTIKRSCYGFNKPDAKSTTAMATYGHRGILGFNIKKLTKLIDVDWVLST